MTKMLSSPGRYIQGPGELSNLGTYTEALGKKALILISKNGYERFGKEIAESLSKAGLEWGFDAFTGECTKDEIDRVSKVIKDNGFDIVVGAGGGKIFDTAKAAADAEKTPTVIFPTVASSDAPCSGMSVVYTKEGLFQEYLYLSSNPNVVMLDTDIIIKSPVRFTVAGMGDALSTYFEARACKTKDIKTCSGGKATVAAMGLAERCYDTLIAEGLKAKIALQTSVLTEAVEKVIEANILLSGLGYGNGGIAGAHAIHNGLTAIDDCHHMYHGEKVAFGTITQLVLENVPDNELEEVIKFCISVGLPVNLNQLGIDEITEEKIYKVAQIAAAETETMHNLPLKITPERVYSAIMAANATGNYYLGA